MSRAKSHFVDLDGLKVHYLKLGNGPPLVLFHGGWATGRLNWSRHFDALARHFTVYAADHRGHGHTNNPAGKFTTYAGLAWDMIALIEALKLDEKPVVMGHSSGALICLHISSFAPDLLARQVLIGIHPHLGVSESWKRGMEKFFHTKNYRHFPSMGRYIWNEPLNALALWWSHRETPWFQLLKQAWPMWSTQIHLDADAYRNISIPTLVITGDRDEFGTAQEAAELADRIKGAKFAVVPNADHMFVVDHPEWLQDKATGFLLGS